jgi:UDP-N-acetylmuramoyl-L-alanyl-D-glutamate--2,6-diaminopimelate ligase
MEDYFEAKARLFRAPAQGGLPLADKIRVANADDLYCRRLLAEQTEAIGFGLESSSVPGSRHLSGVVNSLTPAGLKLSMRFEGKTWELSSPLVGGFNAMNLLGAEAMALGLGVSPAELKALEGFTGVCGRLERIPNNKGLNVFVDYAHTPDALIKAISALRDAGFARIVTVFGCGGNRDRTKRPLMGQAVARLADVAVLTSDNPRFEDPQAIIDDVLPGLADCREYLTQPDRRAALGQALKIIGPEDALLVAGKGHETYQIFADTIIDFDDAEIAREILEGLV